jgi:hypothetical protein
VPEAQYGYPNPEGVYRYWDEVSVSPPAGAVYAKIELLYQGTSWEYIQFLWKENKGTSAFLADEGVNLLEAWLNTGMAAPYLMAAAEWGKKAAPPTPDTYLDDLTTWAVGRKGSETLADSFAAGDSVLLKAHVVDETGASLSGAQVFMEVRDGGGAVLTALQGFSDEIGVARLEWKTSRRNTQPGLYQAEVIDIIKSGYTYNPDAGTHPDAVTSVSFQIQ